VGNPPPPRGKKKGKKWEKNKKGGKFGKNTCGIYPRKKEVSKEGFLLEAGHVGAAKEGEPAAA
jgi:hypothetical protein